MHPRSASAQNVLHWLRGYACERINSRLIDERRCIPPNVILDFGNRGLFGLTSRREDGGLELDNHDVFAVFEQLGAIDLSLATHTANVTLATRTILSGARPEVRASYARPLAEGRIIPAFALTEPGAGSDPGRLRCTASSDGQGGFRLTGEKDWIGGGGWAELLAVFALVRSESGEDLGPTAFLVRREQPGVQDLHEADTLGMLGMVQSGLRLTGAHATAAEMLSEVGQGLDLAQRGMMWNRLALSAIALGGVKRCIQIIHSYASRRHVATGLLLDNLVVQGMLAELQLSAMALDRALELVAAALDAQAEVPAELVCALKVFASEALGTAADHAVQLLGARGYDEPNAAAKILRDARAFRIFEGPTETLRTFIGARLEHAPQSLLEFLRDRQVAEPTVARILADISAILAAREDGDGGASGARSRRDMSFYYLGGVGIISMLHALVQAPAPDQAAGLRAAASWLRRRHDAQLRDAVARVSSAAPLDRAALDTYAAASLEQLGDCARRDVRLRTVADPVTLPPPRAASAESAPSPAPLPVARHHTADAPRRPEADVVRPEIIAEANRTLRRFARADRGIHELVADAVSRRPHETAVVAGGTTLSYAELWHRSGAVAVALQSSRTDASSTRIVAIVLERGVDLVLAMLGTLRAGFTYLPIDPAVPRERVVQMLADAAPFAIITDRALNERHGLDALDPAVPTLDVATACASETDAPLAQGASEPAYVIYTSGSSGQPKGAILPHAGVVNWLLWLEQTFCLDENDVVLWKANVGFDHSVWECFLALVLGGKLVIADPGKEAVSPHLVELIDEHAVTVAQFVPAMLQLFTSEAEPSRCSSLRFVMAGGEALPPSVIGAFYQRFPECFLCNCYGPTEASIGATMWPCSRAAGLTEVPIGKPLSNMRIHVLDAALQPVPAGEQGEICIEGSLAQGYLNRPELTQERFVTLPGKPDTRVYRTGDRGAFRADGSLRYLGRIDNQVKVRGMRVELEEVEHAVNQHPSVAQSLASVDRDRFGNTRLICFYKAVDGTRGESVAKPSALELHRFVSRTLPAYMVPARFTEVETFHHTPSGKIDRKQPPSVRQERGASAERGPGATAHSVTSLWEDVLEIREPDPDAAFSELGGNSLLLLQLVSRLDKKFSQEVASNFDQKMSIRELVALIEEQSASAQRERPHAGG